MFSIKIKLKKLNIYSLFSNIYNGMALIKIAAHEDLPDFH
jgi:hypothetical protein